MKKTKLFFVLLAILLAAGCTEGLLEPGSLDDLEIGLTKLTLSANELATISGNELDLTLTKNPAFANKNEVIWESGDTSVAAVDQNGHITTGTTTAEVLSTVIRVYAVDDPSVYAACPVSVYPDYGASRSWTFTTSSQTTISDDRDNGQGMTILAATGSLSAYNEPPQKGLLIIDPEDPYLYGAIPAGGARSGVQLNTGGQGASGFSACYLRTNGNSRMFKIAAIQGPFTVTVNYASNSTPGVHADIRFGDKEGFLYVGDGSASTSDYRTVSWPYAGDDIVPFVYIETQGSVRIFDVIITPGATYPYTPVPDSFTITGANSFIKGMTETYTPGITQTLTNPEYEWEITAGSQYAEIVRTIDGGKSVELRALDPGQVTLALTITTSNPYDSAVTPKSVTQTKTIAIEGYTAISGVTIDPTATVTVEGTVQLAADITPANATSPVYAWIIDGTNGAIASGGDASTVTLSGTAQGAFTVKVRVTTTDPANSSNTITVESGVCTVTVNAAASKTQWEFTTNPSGWTADNATGSTGQPDVDYGNGMTLLAGTGSTNANNDSGTGRTMGVFPTGAIPSSGTTTGFTVGYLRVNGAGTFAKITGKQGPYSITLNYRSPSANSERYPIIKIGTASYNANGTLSTTGPSTAANTGFILTVNYEGTDSPDILLKVSSGGLIFHDVIIEQ
jgi:hypothetical protein